MQPRHRFLEPIYNVKEGRERPISAAGAAKLVIFIPGIFSARAARLRRPMCSLPPRGSCAKDGGAYRDRTDDLKLAKLALSQLS